MSTSPIEILERITQSGGHIQVDGGELDIECRQDVITELLPAIRANKTELMELLTQSPATATLATTTPATPLAAYLTDLAQRGFDGISIATLRRLFGTEAVTELLASGKHQINGDILTLPPAPPHQDSDTERERVAIADAVLDKLDASGGVMLTKTFTPAERQVIAWLQDNELVRVAMGRAWLVSTSNVALTVQACLIQLSRWRKAGFSEVSYTKLGLLYGWGLISHLIKMHVLTRSGDLLQIGDGDGEAVADYGSALVANVHSEATDQAIDGMLAELHEAPIAASEFDQRAGAGAVEFLEALGLVTIDNKRVYPAGGRQ